MINRLVLLLVFCALCWVAAVFVYVQYIAQMDAKTRVDLSQHRAARIVVLTGGTQRIAVAASLLQEGAAGQLFISGVGEGVRLVDILPSLPERFSCCVTLGREASDTIGNAREAKTWLDKSNSPPQQQERILLVTAHYHLPRALWHFTQLMPEVTWLPYAVEPKGFPLKDWYLTLLGWRLMSVELLKFLVAMVR